MQRVYRNGQDFHAGRMPATAIIYRVTFDELPKVREAAASNAFIRERYPSLLNVGLEKSRAPYYINEFGFAEEHPELTEFFTSLD